MESLTLSHRTLFSCSCRYLLLSIWHWIELWACHRGLSLLFSYVLSVLIYFWKGRPILRVGCDFPALVPVRNCCLTHLVYLPSGPYLWERVCFLFGPSSRLLLGAVMPQTLLPWVILTFVLTLCIFEKAFFIVLCIELVVCWVYASLCCRFYYVSFHLLHQVGCLF